MITIFEKDWSQLDRQQKQVILSRPKFAKQKATEVVTEILSQVKQNGDLALQEFTSRYDQVEVSQLAVSKNEIQRAYDSLSSKDLESIDLAIQGVESFHRKQVQADIRVKTHYGIECQMRYSPIQKVGLYVPGGSAPLLSSVIMQAIPAAIAGCETRIMCTPPNQQGQINRYILATAKLCGIKSIYKVGGAQAIAAMAFGTETIPKVDKIFGPGNIWVNTAKQIATSIAGGPSIDLPAGPSEVMVVVDEATPTAIAASDVLAQAEHDQNAQCIVVANSYQKAQLIKEQISIQLEVLPRREIAKVALNNSKMIIASKTQDQIDIINAYAPEHLILLNEENETMALKVLNAGSIFMGIYTPETLGDYISGTNHVLPTGGSSRSYSGLSLSSFLRTTTIQKSTLKGLEQIADATIHLATIEGLAGHSRAIQTRLRNSTEVTS